MPDSRLFASTLPNHPSTASDAVEGWRLAGMRVRLGVHPDEPRLISHYLAIGSRLGAQTRMPPWDIALQSAQLLLDSAADPDLPTHWRCLCLDNVYRPLELLAELADQDFHRRQLASLRRRLATLDMSPDTGAYRASEQNPASQY